MKLLDANILLYAYDAGSEHHDDCRAWLERAFLADEPVGLPWQTILAFIRIVTNPRAVRTPMTGPAACAIAETWLQLPQVVLVDPGEQFWTHFRTQVSAARVAGPMITDAALAALALEQGAALCTTDREFLRFEGLKLLDPTRLS